MLLLIKNKQTRMQLIRRSIELVTLIILVVASVVLKSMAESRRQEAWVELKHLEQQPNELLNLATAQIELKQNEAKLKEATDLLPTRENISSFVIELEKVSRANQVKLQVSEISEVLQYNENGAEVPWTGAVAEIQIRVKVLGEPLKLLTWLYNVDHGPFLAQAKEWSLKITPPVSSTIPAAPGENSVTQEPTATLQAEYILTIQNDAE